MADTDTTQAARAEEHARDFLGAESDLRSEANANARQLSEEMMATWLETPLAEAAVAMFTQVMLERRLWTEANAARSTLGRPPGHVPIWHDPHLWQHLESALVRAAANKTEDLLDEWRQALADYKAGRRDTPPEWPTIEGGAP